MLNSTRKPANSNANLRSLSRLPQVTERLSNSRKKQRDYTIPVRLNQQFPSSSSSSAFLANKLLEGQKDVERERMVMIMEDKQQREGRILEANSQYIHFQSSKYQINVQQQHHKRRQSSLIKMPVSFLTANSKTTRRVVIINQISIKITLMVIAITSLIMLSSMSEFCHCDTYKINTNTNNNDNNNININKNSNSKNDNALHNIQASIESQHGILQGRNNANNRHQSDKSSAINSLNNKENFLSYLTDNIERQHFKNPLKPVGAFVHQRPSKFDSGEDPNEMSSDVSSNLVINRPRAFRNHSTIRHSNVDKADEGLRQIMMMHEQTLPMTTSTSSQKLNQQQEGQSKTNSMTNLAVKLREFSRGPARVASSLINPNKMMSNVLSYISPLVSSKLINSTSAVGSKLNFNPFVGRSNNQAGYSTGTKNRLSLTPSLLSDYSKPSSTVTILPQTSFLAKPNFEKAGERQLSSTQASISLNDFSDTILKSALIKPNISPKDLITSESSDSFNHLSNSDSSSITTTSGVLNESSKKHSEDSGSSLTGTNSRLLLRPLITSYGSSWLRDNANKVAQSYIQDSFRGLLTLSQLPILQSGSISTAPSVLEKGGSRLKDSNKQPESSSSTNSQRTRAIDELYRYAYILGTGVRRKRDPLTALGSSSSGPNLAHSALSNRKGVFSQRSRNQFTANPVTTTTTPASNKQLLDYARNLKSILSTGAKPRGVMWDMATDPSLAVTVFHLLERASVALPLGKLLTFDNLQQRHELV